MEQHHAERAVELPAERGPALQYHIAGCSWEALLSDVRCERVRKQCLLWGVLAGQWSLFRIYTLQPQSLYHACALILCESFRGLLGFCSNTRHSLESFCYHHISMSHQYVKIELRINCHILLIVTLGAQPYYKHCREA